MQEMVIKYSEYLLIKYFLAVNCIIFHSSLFILHQFLQDLVTFMSNLIKFNNF